MTFKCPDSTFDGIKGRRQYSPIAVPCNVQLLIAVDIDVDLIFPIEDGLPVHDTGIKRKVVACLLRWSFVGRSRCSRTFDEPRRSARGKMAKYSRKLERIVTICVDGQCAFAVLMLVLLVSLQRDVYESARIILSVMEWKLLQTPHEWAPKPPRPHSQALITPY